MRMSFSTEHSVHTKYLTDAQSARILFHTYCDFFTSQFKVWTQTTVKYIVHLITDTNDSPSQCESQYV